MTHEESLNIPSGIYQVDWFDSNNTSICAIGIDMSDGKRWMSDPSKSRPYTQKVWKNVRMVTKLNLVVPINGLVIKSRY
jgi:hypothetical protein